MNFSIQCKFKNPKYKILIGEIREFLNTINKKNNDNHIGFFVSNVELSEYALKELNSSPVKNKICVCFYYQIIDKIKEHVNLLKNKKDKLEKDDENRKRKFIELEHENNILREMNKRIKDEKYEKLIEELRKENDELKKKIDMIENQNKKINEKLVLILNKLN
ncbi:792_t:CDS:1 [Cetraspora pellucida]|uniref:792_t:CDS:1 n=1 Tax=Cetraspora pellucida TaxID=1433469 RepID=A0ACA9KCV8_9GLOM|nr:792_t:CDS:1 [Cetraspora pellucida]